MVFDTRVNATEAEEYRYMNPLKKSRPGAGQIRNLHEFSKTTIEMTTAPLHQRKKTRTYHLHQEMNTGKMYDPYSYMKDAFSAEEELTFINKEQTFFQMMLLKSDLLTKQLWRE